MPSGKSFKFHGSSIAVMTGFESESPSAAITGISSANPAVVTSTAHGLSDGDVVRITAVAGMTELNDGLYIVNVLTDNTFELVGVDSSGYGTYASGGVFDVAAFSNFCELTGYNRQGGSKPEENTTSLCSDAQEYELGLRDFGTTAIEFKFAPQTAIQQAIADFDESGDPLAVKVTLPNSGGIMVQRGFIQQTSEQVAVGGIWRGSLTIRNTGARADFAAA